MNDGTFRECQLALFSKRLTWSELPRDVRDTAIDALATLCVEIVFENPQAIPEQDHEPSDH